MKIAIAGFGLEGESSYRYWSRDPKNQITIVDEKQPSRTLPQGVETIIGSDAFDRLADFDIVVRSPSLAPQKIKTNGKIWSTTNEFFDKCPAMIIGVTGSKGKSTTVSLITSILRAAGKKVWLVGNIGQAVLDILDQIDPNDIVVYEMSSFQLWDIKKSPHIAVVLFIEQEHLNVHADMAEYVNAKANITRFQTKADVLVYNLANPYAAGIAEGSMAQRIGYPDQQAAHIKDDCFYYGEQKICSIEALQILGPHHQLNACAAIDAAWNLTQNTDAIERGLRDFKGLPYRLQFVREVRDVRYYDDSIATTPSSAIAALRTFNTSKVIILGGSSKGSDFNDLAKELTEHEVNAILIGDEASKIAEACQKAGFADFEIIDHPVMSEVVKRAQTLAKPGGVVLLSPASASFGLFKDYTDRGRQFDDAVKAL
jgi:UDP-N-acetylmuramoylalanine--D-glutamate ligase